VALHGRKDAIGHALKIAVTSADRDALRTFAASLPADDQEAEEPKLNAATTTQT
jgi:hypothetical protein